MLMQRSACFKHISFFSIILFVSILSAAGYASSWNGRGQNDLWSNASNWIGGIPGPADYARWNLANTTPCYLNHNAGTIDTLMVSEYQQGHLIIQDGGSLTVTNYASIMNRSGSITVQPNGLLHVIGDLIIGQWDDLPDDEMILTMNGGTIVVEAVLRFGFYFDGVNGQYTVKTHAQLNGGELYAGSVSGLQADRGTIDITHGKLILNGNHKAAVQNWVTSGFLTAYDGNGIITYDYDRTNQGKTAIWAAAPVNGDRDGDFNVDFDDLFLFVGDWLSQECGVHSDFTGDCKVNMQDLAQMSENWFYGVSLAAFDPNPADGQVIMPSQLSWKAPAFIDSFDIYFGMNYMAVLNADHESPEFQGTQSEKNFAPGLLYPDEHYYWRIDVVLGDKKYPGTVWSFSTVDMENAAGFIGATCGWQYSAQIEGPLTYPNQTNISLYNPQRGNPTATWEDWAAQITQAGLDFICPNLTGSWPNTGSPPADMAPLVTALNNLGNVTKFAIFDDNAASWCAQWNMAEGRGFWYAEPFDISDPANWVFIYDYNYKLFYETVPDAQRFKIDGRPVIWIWTGNPYFVANSQGNLSRAMLWVRQRCMEDFGFNPYIVGNRDFISNDSTCANPGVLDATHSWFGPPNDPWTLSVFNGVKTGVAVAQFQNPSNPPGFLDPDHGNLLNEGLHQTVGAGALMTLLEGFTDYEEDAALFRVRNLDENGNPLSYEQTYYDYPNQRLNIIRKHSRHPFPAELKLEAEGCDTYGGAAGGGTPRLYRNGNIGIEPTQDEGGGFSIGWIQPNEWFQWEEVPMEGSGTLQVRVAANNDAGRLHFVIDGQVKPAVTLPDTGGFQSWATVDTPPETFAPGSYHTVRLICETSGMNINWIRWVAGGTDNAPPRVVINSPVNNSTYAEPAAVTIEAAAFDEDGTISKVDFYHGSTLLGTDTAAPYSFTWNNVPAGDCGSYRLSAKAVDNQGAVSTSLPVFMNVTPLSLNKPAYASFVVNRNVPSRAADNDLSTRWESAYSDPQWIYIDLGAVYDIGKIVLKWEAAYASSYQIQISDDAVHWTTVYSTTVGDGGYDVLNVSAAGRYVRMYGTTRGTIYGYSLYDFKVYMAY